MGPKRAERPHALLSIYTMPSPMPTPYTSSVSQSPSAQVGSANLSYPSLRPASSIRMNAHQVAQGFAPKSEQTFRYYQIQPSSSTPYRESGPAFPTAHTSINLPRPLPLPSSSSSQSSSPLFPSYPEIHNTALRTRRANAASVGAVEQEATDLLQSVSDAPSSSLSHKFGRSIRGVTTEGGEPLRSLILPSSLITKFVSIAEQNTRANIETCGMLMGTIDSDMLQVNHLLIPRQSATSDRCDTEDEEGIWRFMDSKGLVTLGWCHTHPQQ
jgi:hypothetical protein